MEAHRPSFSVVIPTYNRERLLRLTLSSLVRQTLPAEDFEVIVVDDGSSDGSEQAVAEFADRLRVRYLFQEDRGYRVAAARNLGIDAAAGEFCVFVDSGVMLESGALAAFGRRHASTAGPAAVCGYVFCFNEDNEDAALIEREIDYDDPDTTIRRLRERGEWLDYREEFYAKYGDEFADLPAPWLVYWTCNVSAPTALLREIGGFDEAFRTWGGEDVDLAYRLHRAGARFVLGREAAGIHVPHPKSQSENMASTAPNNRYIVEKYDTPVTRLVDGTHFWVLNDLIRERALPACAEYLATADPAAGSVLVAAAHARDAALACGGTVARWRARGHQVVLAVATAPSDEAVVAARTLGVDAADLCFLGDVPEAELRTALGKLLADLPDVTEVYIPHLTRHEDPKRRALGTLVTEGLTARGIGTSVTVYRYVLPQPAPVIGADAADLGAERLITRDVAPYALAKASALGAYGPAPTPAAPRLSRQLETFWIDEV